MAAVTLPACSTPNPIPRSQRVPPSRSAAPLPGPSVIDARETVVRVPAGDLNPLGYVAYLPAGYASGTGVYPAIVFLHGYGERGDGGPSDLNIISTAALPRLAATTSLPTPARRFVILAPQINADRWDPQQVHNWLASVLGRYRVDPDRLYLTQDDNLYSYEDPTLR